MALTDNIAAAWHLDEASGTRADATGNGRNLAETSGTISSTTGKIDSAAQGSGGGSYLAVADSIFDGNQSGDPPGFTFACWFKSSGSHVSGQGIGGFSDTDTNDGWRIELNTVVDDHFVIAKLFGSVVSLTLEGPLTLDAWTFIVLTWDGSAAKLYINGSLVDSDSGLAFWGPTQTTFYFGGVPGESNLPCTGSLDEAAYWVRELTAEEVTELYNGGDGLAYPFEGGPSPPAFKPAWTAGSNQVIR